MAEIMKTIKVCEKHGEYASEKLVVGSLNLWSGCGHCAMERDVGIAKNKEGRKEHEAYKAAKKNMENSGIPLKYKNSNFDGLEISSDHQSLAVRYSKRYAEAFGTLKDEGVSLIFFGSPGTGKTHLACAIALEVIQKGFSCRYITAFDLLNEISDTFRTKEPTNNVVKKYVSSELLILDEVGIQYGRDHDSIWLYKIINTRYVNNLPTIVISNLDEKKLEEFIGSPTYDRLQEGKGKAIPFMWESHRRKATLKLAS